MSSKHKDTILGDRQRVHLLNTWVDVLTMAQTLTLVEEYIISKTPLHLIGVNADKINEINRNSDLKRIVDRCGIINADGTSVVMASKLLRKPLPERVAGIDLMQNLVELSANKGYSIFLLGAKQEVVEKCASVLKDKYPDLTLCGVRNGYFKESQWPAISAELQEKQPDIVFVGISSPTKEYLIQYLQNQGHSCVFMGVGGSFDVISGNIPRAPKWMQHHGLEWFFRMIQEPCRLFSRYFVGNTQFIAQVAMFWLCDRLHIDPPVRHGEKIHDDGFGE